MSTTTTKIEASSHMSIKHRQFLFEQLKKRFRKKPTGAMKPVYSYSSGEGFFKDQLRAEVEALPEFQTVQKALARLARRTKALYGAPLVLGVTTDGRAYTSVPYDRDDASTNIVHVLRRAHNAAAEQHNEDVKAQLADAVAAWGKELGEKQLAVYAARTIEELLTVVPELRVALPTEHDRRLGYSERTSTAVLDVPSTPL